MIKDMWQSRWDCIILKALLGKISICKRIFFNKIACMVLLVSLLCSLGVGHQEGLLFCILKQGETFICVMIMIFHFDLLCMHYIKSYPSRLIISARSVQFVVGR